MSYYDPGPDYVPDSTMSADWRELSSEERIAIAFFLHRGDDVAIDAMVEPRAINRKAARKLEARGYVRVDESDPTPSPRTHVYAVLTPRGVSMLENSRKRTRKNPDWKARGYIGAGIVVVDERGLVLGITRGFNMADIGLPGGKADPEDPSLEVAASREAFEETGVRVDPATLVYVTENPGPRGTHVTFFAPRVIAWPTKFGSDPFEGYVGFFEPAAFVNPAAPYRAYNERAFKKLGLL